MSRDFDSNPGISVNLSRDWTSLGWQVCILCIVAKMLLARSRHVIPYTNLLALHPK